MNSDLAHEIIRVLTSHVNPVKTFFLKKELCDQCICIDDFDDTLCELLRTDKIKYTSDGIKCSKADLKTAIQRSDDIVIKYFSGQSTDNLSKEYSMSNDAIKEHIVSSLGALEINDAASQDYQKYKMTQKQFLTLYDADKETFRYFQLIYDSGRRSLNEVLDDSSKTTSFRERFNSSIRKSVEIDGKIVELKPINILSYILETSHMPIGDKSLLQKYNQFLLDNNLETYEYLTIDRNYIKILTNKENGLVYINPTTLIYSPHSKKELLMLFSQLNLSDYNGMYIYTQLIVKRNKELLDQYGINYYALYCLMYKYRAHLSKYKIQFVRIPSLMFGKADLHKQIEDTLKDLGTIPISEFYKIFEDKYGVSGNSLRSSYMKSYRKYIEGGKYCYNMPRLSECQLNDLRPLFPNAWYSISDAKIKFETKLGKEGSNHYFNAYNLDALGYHMISNVIYLNKYTSISSCIEDSSCTTDYFKIEADPQDSKTISQLLNKLKNNLDAVPISCEEYITIKKLNELGITKQLMMSYASNFLSMQNKGKCFTLFHMRYLGYYHELEDFGFDDIYYQTLIEVNPDVKSSTISNVPVFLFENKYNKNTAISSIVDYAMGDENSIDVYDLSTKINELFGVDLENELKTSDLYYYNTKTMKVYRDRDVFYEELRRP